MSAAGNPDCKTPNLDRFSQQSVYFENAFAQCPKCVHSRISMITGRYPNTDGIRTINEENLLPADAPNLLGSLKAEGYQSAVFGINHVWETLWASNAPGEAYADAHSWTEGYDDIWDQPIPIPVLAAGSASAPPENRLDYQYGSRLLETKKFNSHDDGRVEQALRFLRKGRDPERPFYLHLNISDPHPAYEVEEPWFSMYDRKRIKAFPRDLPTGAPLPLTAQRTHRVGGAPDEEMMEEIQAVYYGMVSKVDALLGKVFECIEEQGLLDNSIVLFFSDHGDYASQYGLPEKFDTSLADCLLHVPCMIAAPELPRGKRVDSLCGLVDLTPTLLELLGLGPLVGMHGSSLLPAIKGEASRTAVFASGGHEAEMRARFNAGNPTRPTDPNELEGKQRTYYHCPDAMARAKMVRTREWKLVIREIGGNELYNLLVDPHEMENLYGQSQYSEIEKQLLLRLVEWSLLTDTDRPRQEKVGA
jgi:choline-sulfatase